MKGDDKNKYTANSVDDNTDNQLNKSQMEIDEIQQVTNKGDQSYISTVSQGIAGNDKFVKPVDQVDQVDSNMEGNTNETGQQNTADEEQRYED